MISSGFSHAWRCAYALISGFLLLALAAPTLAENPAQGKTDADAPHIGLILPLNAHNFRQPAEAVKQGFLAAAKALPGAPEVRVYPTNDEVSNILAAYQAALSKGARVIVGPLTKNAVGALADSDITLVPTLALSVPDIEIAHANLYLFGLSLDAETRQLAQFVAHEGRHSVLVLYSANSFGKRLQATFSDEWLRLGGQILEQSSIGAGTDFKALHERVAALQPDAIFLATNAHEAQRVRPYLFETIPLYATSQVFRAGNEANRTLDLDGVRFLDMPWLLQPDHPAVMVYPRAERALGTDGERLYAMGIDAFRLAQLFFRGEMPTSGLVLDGVTGQISLGANHQFTRELSTAEFQDDEAVVRDHAKP
jgi:outer membrane PBP1 activator LpoA protein